MKVLIPLDGSHFAEAAIPPVLELVRSSGAEVHLIQVVDPAGSTVDQSRQTPVEPHARGDVAASGVLLESTGLGLGNASIESSGQADERLRQNAKDYLDGIAHRFFPEGTTTVAVTGNHPSNSIRDYARQEDIGIIAIATHGRTGLARLVMGSIAADLLKEYVAPLLMVRPDGLHS